jgi:hypothetical protein
MTSVLKSYGQIDPDVKYMIALSGAIGYEFDSRADALTQMTDAEFSDATTTTSDVSGAYLKDMGHSIVTYASASSPLHTAVYRAIQIVDGSETEGVPSTYRVIYVKVWSADGQGVKVIRTGPGA